ncbi:hypothetical protein HK096_010517 [Nowakowskiella sp. JEL0078]|nr:hypothetical protein HK096_010517 [Nowakowskiella sp. JEL0078]
MIYKEKKSDMRAGEINRAISIAWTALDKEKKQKHLAEKKLIREQNRRVSDEKPNPFFAFFASERSKISGPLLDISKSIGTKWKDLPEDEKAGIEEKTKSNHIDETINVENNLADNSKKRTRKAKDPNEPKGWKNAFMWFCKEKRQEVLQDSSVKLNEVQKILSQMWKEQEDRVKYQQMADGDKVRYDFEKRKYLEIKESKPQAQDFPSKYQDQNSIHMIKKPKLSKSEQRPQESLVEISAKNIHLTPVDRLKLEIENCELYHCDVCLEKTCVQDVSGDSDQFIPVIPLEDITPSTNAMEYDEISKVGSLFNQSPSIAFHDDFIEKLAKFCEKDYHSECEVPEVFHDVDFGH